MYLGQETGHSNGYILIFLNLFIQLFSGNNSYTVKQVTNEWELPFCNFCHYSPKRCFLFLVTTMIVQQRRADLKGPYLDQQDFFNGDA